VTVYFFLGRHDVNAPTVLVEEYVQVLDALTKGIVWFEHSGHSPWINERANLPPDRRGYENIYDYCSMCGKCAKNCPANAISVEKGKDHRLCFAFLEKTSEKYKPRYGCGKCQVGVPCESRIP